MKRIRNSVKAIIVAVSVLVVALGVVLGVVLGTRAGKKPVVKLSAAQKQLLSVIQSERAPQLNLAEEINLDAFVFEDESKIDVSSLSKINEDFLTYKDSYGYTQIYVKTKNSSQEIVYKDLFDVLDIEKTGLNYKEVLVIEGNLVSIAYSYDYVLYNDLIDISDIFDIQTIESIRTDSPNRVIVYEYSDLLTGYYILDEKMSYMFTPNADKSKFDLKIFYYADELKTKTITNLLPTTQLNAALFTPNSFFIVSNNVMYGAFGCGNEIVSFEVSVDLNDSIEYDLTENYLFATETVNNANSYSYLSAKNTTFTSFVHTEGYSKAVFKELNEDYFYVFEQKLASNGTSYESTGLMTYFEADSNKKVFVYEAKSINDVIVGAQNNRLLLVESGIISTDKNNKSKSVYSLEKLAKKITDETISADDIEIRSDVLVKNTFTIAIDDICYIMNMKGNLVYNKAFTDLIFYDNIVVAESDLTYSILNLSNKTEESISNYSKFNSLNIFNLGYFFVDNFDSDDVFESYSVYKYSDSLNPVYENVERVDYVQLENETLVKLVFLDDSSKVLYTGMRIQDVQISEDPEPYSTYGVNASTYGMSIGGSRASATASATADENYKYPSSGKFEIGWCDGYLVPYWHIGHFTFSYDYSNGTASYPSTNETSSHSCSASYSTGVNLSFSYYCRHGGWEYASPYKLDDTYKSNSSTRHKQTSYALYSTTVYDSSLKISNYTNSSTKTLYSSDSNKNYKFVSTSNIVGAQLTGYSEYKTDKLSDSTTVKNVKQKYEKSKLSSTATDNAFFSNTKVVTYYSYAVYSPYSYTVTTYSETDKGPASQLESKTIVFGDSFSLTLPTKAGYTFKGWTITGMCTTVDHYIDGVSVGKGSSTTVNDATTSTSYRNLSSSNSGSVEFAPIWEANNYSIQFQFVYVTGSSSNYSYEGYLEGSTNTSQFNRVKINDSTSFSIDVSGEVFNSSNISWNAISATSSFNYNENGGNGERTLLIMDLFYLSGCQKYINKSNILVFGSQYQFDQWIVEDPNNRYNYAPANNSNIEIINYLNKMSTSTVTFYATYKVKAYNVSVSHDTPVWGSLKTDNFDSSENNPFNKLETVEATYSTRLDVFTAGSSSASTTYDKIQPGIKYDVGSKNTVSFTFALCETYYDIYKIVVSNVGYYKGKSGSTHQFDTATITFVYNANTSQWSVSAKTSADADLAISTVTVDGHNYRRVGQDYHSAMKYSYFEYNIANNELDNNMSERLNIVFHNAWYPTDTSGSISETIVNGNGTEGYNVTVYAKSVVTQVNPVTITSGTGAALTLSAQKVVSGNLWFNTIKYPIDAFTTGKTAGYFILKDGKFENVSNTSISFANRGSYDIERLLYRTGDWVYYYSASQSTYEEALNISHHDSGKAKIFDVNYGNGQLIAIEPQQKLIQQSLNASAINAGDLKAYELQSYISKLIVGSAEYSFDKIYREKQTDGTVVKYKERLWLSKTSTHTYTPSNVVNYLGMKYNIHDSFTFTSNGLKYTLLLTRINTVTDSRYNHVMYFIYAHSRDSAVQDIKIQFSEFDYSITTSVSLRYESDKYSGAVTNGATVEMIRTNSGNDYLNNKLEVQPADLSVFRVSPVDGYIIKSIEIKQLGTYPSVSAQNNPYVLYKYVLDDSTAFNNLQSVGSTEKYYTYYYNDGTADKYNIVYASASGALNKAFDQYDKVTGTRKSEKFGIYVADRLTKDWSDTQANFESLYILIGGVYENISITVTTQSYVEIGFVDSSNSLNYTTNGTKLSQINNLHLMVPGSDGWEDIADDSNPSDGDGINYVVKNTFANQSLRVIFVGQANLFDRGLKIMASGATYSSYFTEALLYHDKNALSSGVPATGSYNAYKPASGLNIDGNLFEGRKANVLTDVKGSSLKSSGSIEYNDYLTYIYIPASNFTKTFANSGKMSITAGGGGSETYEFAKKYLINFKSYKNTVNVSTNSYIYNGTLSTNSSKLAEAENFAYENGQLYSSSASNVMFYTNYTDAERNKSWVKSPGSNQVYYCYQLDYVAGSKMKEQSWFNETVLTNVYMYTDNMGIDTDSGKNWQNINKGSKSATQTGIYADNEALNGYRLAYRYYIIPGYYLQYITLMTVDHDLIYIPVSSELMGAKDVISGQIFADSGSGAVNIRYKVEYNHDESCYDIYFFYREDVESELDRNVASIGLMSNDITVNFYSMAYSFNVVYNDNIYVGTGKKISSRETSAWHGLSGGTRTQTLVYDSMAVLAPYMSMTGYTFVGWGSEEYVDFSDGNTRKNRYNLSSNTWNVSSSWFDVSSYFKYSSRDDLLTLISTDDGMNTSDFYFKSSNTNGTNYTGYFITDTGFKSSENYNFWAAYAYTFNNIQKYSNYTPEINLYAMWKANSYSLIFDAYDFDKDNGSTNSNVKKNISGTLTTFNWGFGLDNSNKLILNLSSTGDGASKKTYYFYVTFDTNNWIVVDSATAANKLKSGNLMYTTGASTLVFNDGTTGTNLLDFVIDRYGYSWLGWYSQRTENINEGQTPTSSNLFFGSDYYHGKFASPRSGPSTMPTLNLSNYRLFYPAGGEDPNLAISSEFVYKGITSNYLQHVINNYTTDTAYAYFYDYKSNTNLKAEIESFGEYMTYNYADDFLNKYFETKYEQTPSQKRVFAMFDTSLPYSAYKVTSTFTVTRNAGNYKKLVLHSHWQVNNYTFVIDWRDDPTNDDSLDPHGSDTVKNKESYHFYNNNTAFFDDESLNTALLNFNPIRVGYDFVGWSFYFVEGRNNLVYSNPYILNSDLLTAYANPNGTGANVIPLFTSNGLLNYSVTRTDDFLKTQEVMGDEEAYNGRHYVYIFAIWEEQTFTSNVSLNIEASELKNLYNNDSSFAVAIYENVRTNYDSYTALKNGFVREDDNAFTEIVANLDFVFTFDDYFHNGYTMIGNKKFYIKDLFAVSTGYYFVGWLLRSGDENSKIIANTLQTTFSIETQTDIDGRENGYATNKNVNPTGSSQIGKMNGANFVPEAEGSYVKFDINLYKKLYVSLYKDTNAYASGHKFLTNNLKEIYTTVDAAGSSTNFGYFTNVSSGSVEKMYITSEKKTAGGKDYQLYFKYKGVKYYVLIFIQRGSDNVVLSHDESFLYYSPSASLKYVIRFDTDGSAYYVDSNYNKRVILNLRVAAFADPTANIKVDENLLTIAGSEYSFDFDDVNEDIRVKFTACTTRQFTLYADWEIKTEVKMNVMNGNNESTNPTSYSNPGLAGFYEISRSEAGTGIGAMLTSGNDSYNEPGITQTLNFYDELNLNIMPYFNGRFLSEMNIRFYRIEIYDIPNDSFRTRYRTVIYDLKFKFDWNNVDNRVELRSIILYKDQSSNGTNCSFSYVYDNTGAVTLKDLKIEGDVIPQLSILDQTSFADNFFILNPFGTYNGRIDTHQFMFDFDDVMTNIDITCKFSVQTYEIDLYNILDDNGNNIRVQDGQSDIPEGEDLLYDTNYSISDFAAAKTNGITNYPPYISSQKASKTNLATISVDAASQATGTGYNVPYGYFIYGMKYQSTVTPMKDEGGKYVDQAYSGYEYIYSYGYYNYGSTQTKLESSGTDVHFAQGSPILGGTVFPQSIRLSLSFYDFSGWFEYIEDSGKVIFKEYKERENKYINRNITLYGYYYARNNPTSLQFYTWDSDTRTYKLYTGNANDYTLNAEITDSPFVTNANGELVPKENKVFYADDNGYAMVNTLTIYGVDQIAFKEQEFTLTDISESVSHTADKKMIGVLARNYWRYHMTYDRLFFMDSSTKRYIKYDTLTNEFYYNNAANAKVVVNITTSDFQYFAMVESNGSSRTLQSEEATYYYLPGSRGYILIRGNSAAGEMDRYYEIKELTTSEINSFYASGNASGKAYVVDKNFRYYVDIEGVRYYMMARNKGVGYSSPTQLYKDNGSTISEIYDVVNVDAHYMIYEGRYHEIVYPTKKDDGQSAYINPYKVPGQVTVLVDNNPQTYYLNYENDLIYYTAGLVNRVNGIEHSIYCPVNENYAVNTKYDNKEENGCWIIKDITINQLPSPNLDYWYANAEYAFIGYVRLDENVFADIVNINGPIYQTFSRNIDILYASKSQKYRDNLKAEISKLISQYTMDTLLSSFLFAHSYEIADDNTKYIERIYVNIPCNFQNVQFKDENGVTQTVSLTYTVVKDFMVITKSTVIDTDIMAIPIYSPYVMKFNNGSQTINAGTGVVEIATDKMNVLHFETSGDTTHIYNTANEDYLRFVVLTAAQYDYFKKAVSDNISASVSSVLQSMIYASNYKDLMVESGGRCVIPASTYGEGEYYIMSFYYKTGQEESVVRVSDNLIKLNKAADGTLSYVLESTTR